MDEEVDIKMSVWMTSLSSWRRWRGWESSHCWIAVSPRTETGRGSASVG